MTSTTTTRSMYCTYIAYRSNRMFMVLFDDERPMSIVTRRNTHISLCLISFYFIGLVFTCCVVVPAVLLYFAKTSSCFPSSVFDFHFAQNAVRSPFSPLPVNQFIVWDVCGWGPSSTGFFVLRNWSFTGGIAANLVRRQRSGECWCL